MKLNKESRKLSKQLFKASFENGVLDRARVSRLVEKLAVSKPRNYLNIFKNYHRLLRIEMDKHHATIESATELSPEIAARVTQDLKARYGGDLTTEMKVNPQLVGGLRIRIGSDVWDGSVRARLERLEQALAAA